MKHKTNHKKNDSKKCNTQKFNYWETLIKYVLSMYYVPDMRDAIVFKTSKYPAFW